MEPTPANIIPEIQRIQIELEKAPEALYLAEIKLAEAENALDKQESLSILNAEAGTVVEKQAIAKIESAALRLDRDLARAEVNRVKTKIRTLESAAVATAVIAKQIELVWKTA
jgi:hypothetical protein